MVMVNSVCRDFQVTSHRTIQIQKIQNTTTMQIRKYSKATEQTFEQSKPNIPCTQRFTEVFIAPAFFLLVFCIFYDLYCCCCAQVVLCSKVSTLLTWIFLLCVFHVSYKWMCKMLIRFFIIKHDHFNVFFYMKINGQCGYKICLLFSNILNILYTILIKCTLFSILAPDKPLNGIYISLNFNSVLFILYFITVVTNPV